ncbi:hypothetical protein E3N88_09146 [Mikania micrantha]|uniref:Uncharacterized protein n=1 Tax=Mikania micrantha TaxID=192012 RepID=A0A5N6PI68_9ASTR|nr:hypothetical protein E3N88_09146 [Mikania micrantha]
MSIANQRASSEYQEAIRAIEETESPSLGFVKPSDYKTGATSLSSAIIKQNNTLIYLLIKQAQRLEEFEEEVGNLRRNIEALGKREAGPANLEESIEGLTKRIDNLSIKAPTKVKQGPIYVFKDPNKIFQEEYAKEVPSKRKKMSMSQMPSVLGRSTSTQTQTDLPTQEDQILEQ